MNANKYSIDDLFSSVLKAPGKFPKWFPSFSRYFELSHNDYFNWLKEKIKQSVNDLDFLHDIGIDWITIHYKSRHPISDISIEREWFHIGVSISKKMEKYEELLQVYPYRESPYISFFSQKAAERREPVNVIFYKNSITDFQKNWLYIKDPLQSYLKKITKGLKSQPPFTRDQVNECKKISLKTTKKVKEVFSKLSGKELSYAEALGLLRNSCRVTMLILKESIKRKDDYIKLPRVVTLAPVFTEEDIVGGIAFIGNKLIKEELIPSFLFLLANSLLSGIRLREEANRELSIRNLEELSKARAEFVQSISHSIYSPLEAISYYIQDAIQSFQKLNKNIKDLDNAASNLILAFARDDIDDLLRINLSKINVYDFIETVEFIFKKQSEIKGIQIKVSDINKNWAFKVDKNALMEVFSNILSNAMRYAQKKIMIEVKKENRNRLFIFKIADDGPGIHPNMVNDLFKPGIRNKYNHKNSKLHGFGLFLSKRILEKHKGRIDFDENYKSGARFIIEIPEE